MHSYCQQSKIHCQSGISNNVPTQKRTMQLKDPFCIQMFFSCVNAMQIQALLHHGGILRKWYGIVCFLYHGGTLWPEPFLGKDTRRYFYQAGMFVKLWLFIFNIVQVHMAKQHIWVEDHTAAILNTPTLETHMSHSWKSPILMHHTQMIMHMGTKG